MRFLPWAAAVMISCLGTTAWAASDRDVTVNSDSLQIQDKTGDIQFQGKVEVRMGDVVLSCDFLTVHADEADTSSISSGEASGNIVLTRERDRVEAREAVFDLVAGYVELTGDPRLIREETIIEAEKIVYSIEEGTASFSGPVRALFKAPGD